MVGQSTFVLGKPIVVLIGTFFEVLQHIPMPTHVHLITVQLKYITI